MSIASDSSADSIIAVAANFAPTAVVLAEDFERRGGGRVEIISGASGSLYAQIVAGAPFSAFLSADTCRPLALAGRAPALAATQATYALGRLVLYSPSQPLRLDGAGWPLLRDQDRIALANPRVAPYGAAAVAVLEQLPNGDRLTRVQTSNVAQAFAVITAGHVAAGFVAAAQVPRDAVESTVWPVPTDAHPPIYQDAILTPVGESDPTAKAFLSYLMSEAAQALLLEAGFAVPADADAGRAVPCS
ncbi:MAG: molybdate ABC transporter substrate-binding protein [Pseudomonadota bacterium]